MGGLFCRSLKVSVFICPRIDLTNSPTLSLLMGTTVNLALSRQNDGELKGCDYHKMAQHFSVGRTTCKSRIGNGKKERSKRKKHNWKSEGNAILLEELCVSNTRKSCFTKNICLLIQEGRQTVRGSPLGLRQGGGPSSKVNGPTFQVSDLK